jgi:hypothetical protein
MFTPGAFPVNALTTSVEGFAANSSALIVVTAYPKAFFSFLIPWLVTTTSPNTCASAFIVTFIFDEAPTVIEMSV